MSATEIAVRAKLQKCKKCGKIKNGSKWWQEKELPPITKWFLEHDRVCFDETVSCPECLAKLIRR